MGEPWIPSEPRVLGEPRSKTSSTVIERAMLVDSYTVVERAAELECARDRKRAITRDRDIL